MTNGLLVRAWAELLAQRRPLLGFHLLLQLLGIAIFAPILSWVTGRLVRTSGDVVISNYDIAGFVLTPPGLALILVTGVLTIGILLVEFTGLSWLIGCRMARQPVTAMSTIAFVIGNLFSILRLATRLVLELLLLALPFAAALAAIWFLLLAGQDINYYLAENPPAWVRAQWIAGILAVIYILLAGWRLARWIFAIPILAFEGVAPSQALARSAALTRGRLRAILGPIVSWWLLLTVATALIGWVSRVLSDAGLDWAGVDVSRVLPLVACFIAFALVGSFLYGAIGLAGHQYLVTRLYAEQVNAGRWRASAFADLGDAEARGIARPTILVSVALLTLALGTSAYLFSQLDLRTDVAITAHRGASIAAPENSMAAFRAAIDAGASYAELDVQHTLDRQIVVTHDGDLLRTGGDPRAVGMLTYAEIAGIDIGSRFDARFADERAPTLGQVIDLVRGRMRLNVELKYNVADAGLAPAVVSLLRERDFLDQAIVTSLDYAALQQVRRMEPRLRTGHIVTAAVGDIVSGETDILSVNAARVTASLLRRAHRAGKEVHVWTVNTPEAMLRMLELGVDNIITDDPAGLASLMRMRNTLTAPELLGLRLRVLFAEPPREITEPAAVEPL